MQEKGPPPSEWSRRAGAAAAGGTRASLIIREVGEGPLTAGSTEFQGRGIKMGCELVGENK